MRTENNDLPTLWLYEEVLLVALRDDKGTVHWGIMHSTVLGGAILADLFMVGRIGLDETKRKPRVAVLNPTPTGNELVDECLQRIVDSKRLRKPEDWVMKFSNTKKLDDRAAQGLVELGALRREEGKVLFVFPSRRYPEADPTLEGAVLSRVGDAIFGVKPVEDPRTATLVSLLSAGDMLKIAFDKKQLKARKDRVKEIVSGDASGAAVKAAIEAVNAAIIAAVVASTAAASAG